MGIQFETAISNIIDGVGSRQVAASECETKRYKNMDCLREMEIEQRGFTFE